MSAHRNYINGAWVESAAAPIVDRNPSDIDDVVGSYAAADAAQTRRAIEAARAAFPAWSRSSIQERADLLDAVGGRILARAQEIGRLLAREEGKTLKEAVGETMRAGHVFKFHAGQALRITGELVDSPRKGVSVTVQREPLGVIGIITPWNFPIAIPAWKIAPALAYANCVVFKPASLVPGCAHALAELLADCGCPPGVFNLVVGSGREVGDAIVNAPEVDAISFTGSVETGRALAARAVAGMKKIQLEMGGKNPLIVLDDADLDNAVECAVQGAFYSTGQRCTATSRVIVTPGIYGRFRHALLARTTALVVGDALDETTQIGPAVDAAQLKTDLDYIAVGQKEGARLVAGGERQPAPKNGFYIQPTVFEDVHNQMRIAREEIFGPVVSLLRARDYDEALATANDTPFGLSGGICTTSLRHADHFRRNAQVGLAMINAPTAGVDYHVPFGGVKGSSYGSREQGAYAVEFYTRVKTVYTNANIAG
ncbi:MAG: aldehyde dehydrogenase family protein [Candidatus Rokuibacteriota bacterium]|nr:MAG: aldehyde dehydrogenase family protein [Candidatus Rokubacteria bacterium]